MQAAEYGRAGCLQPCLRFWSGMAIAAQALLCMCELVCNTCVMG